MIENSFVITTTFIANLIMMLAIGVIAYKRTSNSTDYFLGGRSLGPWPAALSAGASDMSGWLLLGLSGYAYAAGFEGLCFRTQPTLSFDVIRRLGSSRAY